MRVGLDIYTLRVQNLTAREALQFALDHRLQGVQFGNPRQLSPTLDAGELREVAEEFRHHGLYLELGLPPVNPHARSALAHEAGGEAAADAHISSLEEAMRAAAAAGTRTLRSVVGWEEDRYKRHVSWAQQCADITDTLLRLAPVARDLGQKIGIETHCDITTHEILRVIEAVGDDVVAVCLDTGNLPTRMEDPIAATRRIAPYVICTHTKDALLFTTERSLTPDGAQAVLWRAVNEAGHAAPAGWPGSRITDGRGNSVDPRQVPPAIGWQSRPCGQGSVAWPEMIAILGQHVPELTLSIEDHENIQTMPIYEEDWLSSYPDLTPYELAQLVRLAHEGDRRIAANEIPTPFAAESMPWPDRTVRQIDESAAYLRSLLQERDLLTP